MNASAIKFLAGLSLISACGKSKSSYENHDRPDVEIVDGIPKVYATSVKVIGGLNDLHFSDVVLSPDGKSVIGASSEDDSIHVVSRAEGKLIETLDAGHSRVEEIQVLQESNSIATMSYGHLNVWKFDEQHAELIQNVDYDCLLTNEYVNASIAVLKNGRDAFIPDSRDAGSCGGSQGDRVSLALTEIKSQKILSGLTIRTRPELKPDSTVAYLQLSEDNKILAAKIGTFSSHLCIVDVTTRKTLRCIDLFPEFDGRMYVRKVAISPGSSRIAALGRAAGGMSQLEIIDANTGTTISRFGSAEGFSNRVYFLDEDHLLYSLPFESARVWDLASQRDVFTLANDSFAPKSWAISRRDKKIFDITYASTIKEANRPLPSNVGDYEMVLREFDLSSFY